MEEIQRYLGVLEDTLDQQIGILEKLMELTRQQEHIAAGEELQEEALEDTIRRKGVLIDRLNELDEGFVSVYERVRQPVVSNPAQYRDAVAVLQQKIKLCTDLGVELRVLEERNRARFSSAFARKHKDYGIQTTAASVASRYYQTMRGTQVADSYFFNKKN